MGPKTGAKYNKCTMTPREQREIKRWAEHTRYTEAQLDEKLSQKTWRGAFSRRH